MPRAKLTDAPTWHPTSNAWRKRATIGGKQVTRRYKHPQNKAGARKAHAEWLAEYGRLVEAAADDRDEKNPLGWYPPTPGMPFGSSSPPAEPENVKGQTWASIADEFEESERWRLERGEIAPITFGRNSQRVASKVRRDWGSLTVPQNERELGAFLGTWRAEREKDVSSGDISAVTLGTEAGQLGKFLRWANRNYKLPCHLPRNIDDIVRQGTYVSTAKSVDFETLRTIFNAAPERTRLFILLALNCGFKGSDIGRITVGEYERKGGTLDYVRRKTAKKANGGKGVRIRYKLWPLTKTYLDMFAKKGKATDLLLTSESGGPLWFTVKKTTNDYCSQEFSRLCKRADIVGVTFGNLRDTGATWFASNRKGERSTYLAHTDSSVGAKYTDAEAVELDKALADFHTALEKFGKEITAAIE